MSATLDECDMWTPEHVATVIMQSLHDLPFGEVICTRKALDGVYIETKSGQAFRVRIEPTEKFEL